MSNTPVQPGDVLAGTYRVDRVLGSGSMGVVVQATHLGRDERVAVKLMRTEAMADAELSGRFLREARLAVKLRSEHVARVMDAGTLSSGAPYIVMEYLEGGDLEELLSREGPLPFADVAEYLIQACEGIAEAHALGIVHRDLKPANLFLTRRPDGAPLVKVLDFGISKASSFGDIGGPQTRTAVMMGSPFYMSPEQMRSAKNADARSDVWSVGVVLYELVTGRLPFESSSLADILAQILQRDPAPLATHRPDVPPAFEAIVRRCLQRDRNARAQDVGEIAAALAPYAPPRARPVADRIATLLGGDPPTLPAGATRQMLESARPEAPGPEAQGPDEPLPPPAPAPGEGPIFVTVAPAVITATPPRIKGGLGIVLGAIVVGIALGGGAYLWSRRAPPSAAQPDIDPPDVTAAASTAAASESARSRKGLPPARGGRPAPRNTAGTDAPAAKGALDDRSGTEIPPAPR